MRPAQSSVLAINGGSSSIRDKVIEPKNYIAEYGEDMPEIRNWQWGTKK